MDGKLMSAFINFLLVIFGLSFVVDASAGQRDIAAAEVFVYKEAIAGSYRYTYVVKNNGVVPITGLEIGFDYYTGTPELSGDDPSRLRSPVHWSARVVNMEESDLYSVAWESESSTYAIKPGQMTIGFVLESTTNRAAFTNSHWTVILDGSITAASSRIEQIEGPAPDIDTLPPVIRVGATPAKLWPPNKTMRTIAMDISVSDDIDPNPIVKLISISCNECAQGDISGASIGTDDRTFLLRAARIGKGKDGRIYRIKYQAEDSSGNVATATATVQVPHDQR